jgi:hypothetical protein
MDSISIAYIPTDSRAKVASHLKTQGVVPFFPPEITGIRLQMVGQEANRPLSRWN